MSTYLERYSSNENNAAKYSSIEKIFANRNGASMPMSIRKLIQVQLAANTINDTQTLGINQSCRVKAFMAGSVGFAFTMVARIIRIAVFTLCLPVALPVHLATSNRIGLHGAITELFKKYGEEWIDLGATVLSLPLGIVKTISPKAATDLTDKITNYYLGRAQRRKDFFDMVLRAIMR